MPRVLLTLALSFACITLIEIFNLLKAPRMWAPKIYLIFSLVVNVPISTKKLRPEGSERPWRLVSSPTLPQNLPVPLPPVPWNHRVTQVVRSSLGVGLQRRCAIALFYCTAWPALSNRGIVPQARPGHWVLIVYEPSKRAVDFALRGPVGRAKIQQESERCEGEERKRPEEGRQPRTARADKGHRTDVGTVQGKERKRVSQLFTFTHSH